MDYKYINLATETLSILICIIIYAYQKVGKKDSKSDKWLNCIIISDFFMLIGDFCENIIAGSSGQPGYFLMVFFTLIVYYIASGFLLMSIMRWVLSFVEQRRKVSPWWIRLGWIFTSIQVIISITMPITKFNYIDPSNNTYHRGDMFVITQIFPYLVYFMALIILIKFSKNFNKKELFYIGCFTIVPLMAEFVQLVSVRLLLMNVAVSVGLLIIVFFIQLQREQEQEEQMKERTISENKKLENISQRQESLNSQLIDVLCGAVEAKDMYTRGHSMRVAQYAREIMYRLGGDEVAQQEVYCIGILHDVGKISVRDEIINKKGRLDDDEYEQIKLHTVAGYQILKGVDLIPDLAIGARWHHERYDGSGYPNGLAGENIPLIARIISVADAYDAMTSNRSYHSIMPQNEVREQIEKGKGTQFDPQIAQIMLDMIDEDLQYEMRQINYNRITNILLIDDDPFIHDLVDNILVDESYVLSFASSGEEGIELMKENKYDLILLDMEMPGMNGFEVLEWIHSNVRRQKVIFLTGDKDINTIKKSEEYGVADYLTKPIKVRILKESISSVLTH